MDFLKAVDPVLLKQIFFSDQLDAFFEDVVVGDWVTNVTPAFYQNKKSVFVEKKVRITISQGICGSHITAYLDKKLLTLEQTKHDFVENDELSMDKKTTIWKEGEVYKIKSQLIENESKIYESSGTVPKGDVYGFITEGMAIVLQRLIALSKSEDIFTFHSVDTDLNKCEVLFVPQGTMHFSFSENDYEVRKVMCLIKVQKQTKNCWESFFSSDGRIMLTIQNSVPVIFQIPHPLGKGDEKFPIYFSKKTRSKYLKTISRHELKTVVFCEKAKMLSEAREEVGHMTVFFCKSSFQHKHCLFVEFSSLFHLNSVSIHTTIVSHLSHHLETLECRQFTSIQTADSVIHKMLIVYQSDGKFIVKKTVIDGRKVTRKRQCYDKQEFDGFISEASSILIQRILALRNFQDSVDFITLDDDCQICSVIFRPFEPEILVNEAVTGIEYAIIPQNDFTSVWKTYLRSANYTIFKRIQHGFPVVLENQVFMQSSILSFQNECLLTTGVFENGYQFLETIDFEEICTVAFSEQLELFTSKDDRVGEVKIIIDPSTLSRKNHFTVKIDLSMRIGFSSCTTSVNTLLSAHLETIEMTIHDQVKIRDQLLEEKRISMSKTGSKYIIKQVDRKNEVVSSCEQSVTPPGGLPLISEASSILVQRLMVRRKTDEIINFYSIRSTDLEGCSIRYRAVPQEWKNVGDRSVPTYVIESVHTVLGNKPDVWKSNFTNLGKLVYQAAGDSSVKLRLVQSLPFGDEDDYFPLKIKGNSRLGPSFVRSINENEENMVFTPDVLTVVSGTSDEIGSYVSTVHSVEYLRQRAIKVLINSETDVNGRLCGTSIISLIDGYLGTVKYIQIEYLEAENEMVETIISVKRTSDFYEVQCWNIFCDRVDISSGRYTFPDMNQFISEASGLLVKRLMVLRGVQDTLTFFSFDQHCKKCVVQFNALPSSFLETSDGVLELPNIQTVIKYENEDDSVSWINEFTKIGGSVTRKQSSIPVKLIYFKLLDTGSLGKPQSCPPFLSLPSFEQHKFSNQTLHSIESSVLEDILEPIDLLILSRHNEVLGNYSMQLRNVHYKGQHSFLIQIKCVMEIQGCTFSSLITDLISSQLVTIRHKQVDTLQVDGSSWCKTLSYELAECGGMVSNHITFENEEVKKQMFVVKEVDGFITEAVAILLQKFMIRNNFSEILQFNSVDIDGNKCHVTFLPLGLQKKYVFHQDMNLFGVEMEIAPHGRCSTVWHTYFLKIGYIVFRKSLGTSFFFRTPDIPQLPRRAPFALHVLHKNYLQISKKGFNFVQSLTPEDLDGICFPDSLAVSFESGVPLGNFLVFLDNMHYDDLHCFRVRLMNHLSLRGKCCGTSIDAIVTSKLKTLKYLQHDYVESGVKSTDQKILIHLEGDVYEVEKVTINEKGKESHMSSIPAGEVPGLFTEASVIILLRCMVRKRYFDKLEFFGLYSGCEICTFQVKYMGSEIGVQSGAEVEVLKMQLYAELEGRKDLIWDYQFTSDGRLFSRKQVGVPVKIELDSRISLITIGKQIKSSLECSEEECSVYLKKHPEVGSILSNLLHFILLQEPENVFTVLPEFFTEYGS